MIATKSQIRDNRRNSHQSPRHFFLSRAILPSCLCAPGAAGGLPRTGMIARDSIMPHRDVDASSRRARLIILSTGGTIAMIAETAQGGAAMKLGAANGRDVLAKPSADFTLADIAAIGDAAQAAAKTGAGIVITHGTDTLEESAFALSLLVQVDQPIVFTAAMRRPDQPGADGPAKLLAASRVAISPAARGKGILVVADDEIHAGPLIRKAHSFRPHAFSSLPFGPIGYVAEDRVRFALAPASRPLRLTYGGGAPVVPILEAGLGLETQTVEALTAGSIDGLVVSLPGAGHAAAAAVPALAGLAERIPVVFASRRGAGETLRGSYGYPGGEIDLIARGFIPANALDARKARIALQLLLSDQADLAKIRTVFDRF
jgi:L-asparaginase